MTVSGRSDDAERVSVVVPCFNAARYVGEALESVLAQTRPCDEIIVVDDGSTDDSAAVIAQFGGRVRYLHQENQGISAARNRGIAQCSGSCVGFIDADDLWPSHSLETRLRSLSEDAEIDCAYGSVEPFISPDIDSDMRSAFTLPETQPGRVAGSMLVRRAVIDRVGVFDGAFRIGETLDWIARIDAAGFRSRDVGEIVLRRRVHGANTVIKERKMQGDYLRVLRAAIARRREATGQ